MCTPFAENGGNKNPSKVATAESSIIVVRPLHAGDASQASKIWVDGLQQTIDQCQDPVKKEQIKVHFEKAVKDECAPGGMVGVQGEGLVDFWCPGGNNDDSDEDSRCCIMFVAVRRGRKREEVLGIVGIKRGMDYQKFPNNNDDDYNTYSIWKMSVSEKRLGIGTKLMNAAEEWVKEQQQQQTQKQKQQPPATTEKRRSSSMKLYTGNPIASIGFIEIEKK